MSSIRQQFLGEDSDRRLSQLHAAVIGVCGGGSHVAHQLVHIGFGNVHIIDPDFAEAHHGHRMVGITANAISQRQSKVDVVRLSASQIPTQTRLTSHKATWEDRHELLRTCDIVFACVDSYLVRDGLEKYCRRFMLPLIDIGMDVLATTDGHQIAGQIITSRPGQPCMRCLGFLQESLLADEAAAYGAAAGRPQVIWPNGVLASIAVGIGVATFLPWHDSLQPLPYYEYDGNLMTVRPHPRLAHVEPNTCRHFHEVGDVMFSYKRTGS